jgi:hypothetical protein
MKHSTKYSTHCLTLQLEGDEGSREMTNKCIDGKPLKKLHAPLTTGKLPKIYVIVTKGKVSYVGYSHQSITNRLRIGFNADGSTGYHGYKWVHHKEVTMYVFIFENEPLLDPEVLADAKYFYEAVEAELVFLVRKNTEQWPENQNEIHFNNGSMKSARKLAEKIYSEIV